MIDWVLCEINSKKTRIDFSLRCRKKHTYESELMMMSWSIFSFDFARIQSNDTSSQRKFLTICIKYSIIQIVVLTLWKLIVDWNRLNRLKISTSFELNFSDYLAIRSSIIKTHCSRISRTRCLTNCKKFSLSSHIKRLICTNSSRCADTLIKHWKTLTINSKISKKVLLIVSNVKKSLSLLTRIKSIRTLTERFLALDLKSSNRVLVRLLNHHLKIKWIFSVVIIVKNLIISFVIVVNLENRWISTISYEKWTYKRRTILRKISNKTREKSSFHQRRDEERTQC
jgi:hypothetical protein